MNKPENQILVIFGASGDLAKRKLIPSLYELYVRGLLPERFAVLGASRTHYTDKEFRELQRKDILHFLEKKKPDVKKVDEFLKMLYYVGFNTRDCNEYTRLRDRLGELESKLAIPGNIIFYLAVPPVMYGQVSDCLKRAGLNSGGKSKGWRRIIVEKPFGSNEESARQLNRLLCGIFKEDEIYRIDHFLGKETVQNILVLRFANGIFEPLWNRNYIDFVEISAMEMLGVEDRGKYYEEAGALRDMVQNHLLQLMAYVAMEPPAAFDPEAIRDEIVKVFRSLHPYSEEEIEKDVVRAQYIAGRSEGKTMKSYRDEPNIDPRSFTETYVAMKAYIDNWRWGGVPFYIYTGKRLDENKSEIVIHFKSTPQQLFVGQCSGGSCNKLTLRIQPDESISLKFGLKLPGTGFQVKQVSMDFRYASLSENYLPDAYERLLLDAMLGDATLYARSDALEASWRFIDPIICHWEKEAVPELFCYPAGSDGPRERLALFTSLGILDLPENETCRIE